MPRLLMCLLGEFLTPTVILTRTELLHLAQDWARDRHRPSKAVAIRGPMQSLPGPVAHHLPDEPDNLRQESIP